MKDTIFSQLDFGPITEFLNDDNITDISYSNGGNVWLKTLDKGIYMVNRPEINNALMEKLAGNSRRAEQPVQPDAEYDI